MTIITAVTLQSYIDSVCGSVLNFFLNVNLTFGGQIYFSVIFLLLLLDAYQLTADWAAEYEILKTTSLKNLRSDRKFTVVVNYDQIGIWTDGFV